MVQTLETVKLVPPSDDVLHLIHNSAYFVIYEPQGRNTENIGFTYYKLNKCHVTEIDVILV